MSSRQALILASRVICIYLLFWVVSNLIDLPADFLALHQHLSVLSPSSNDTYWSRYYSLRLEALILKTVVELFFAGLFYRCGPRVCQFLAGEQRELDPASISPSE